MMKRTCRLPTIAALLATLAMLAAYPSAASSTAGGHLVSEAAHTAIEGADHDIYTSEFTNFDAGFEFECREATYTGTIATATSTELTLTPTYERCWAGEGEPFTASMNGCSYIWTFNENPEEHGTVHLACPGAKGPEFERVSAGCLITVKPNQTASGGVVYTATKHGTVDGLTVHMTSHFRAVYHGGFFACFIAATSEGDVEIHGTATIQGQSTEGKPVGLVAT